MRLHTIEQQREFCETRAAEMRAEPTEAERALRDLLEPLGFRFQCVIEGFTKNMGQWNYILDAYQPDLKLAVEVDGSSHRNKKGCDRRRDTRLAGEGIVTIRVTNRQVLKAPDEVRVKIAVAIDRLEQGLAYT